MMQLKDLKRKLDATIDARNALDPYSIAHLNEAQQRIAKAIDAIYVYNMPSSMGGGGGGIFIFGQEDNEPKVQTVDEGIQP
jgi:hypothetical protein